MKQQKFCFTRPVMVHKKDSTSELIENEVMFASFFSTCVYTNHEDNCMSIINYSSLFTTVFVRIFFRGLLDNIMQNRVSLLSQNYTTNSDRLLVISDSEKSSLDYTAGFIFFFILVRELRTIQC